MKRYFLNNKSELKYTRLPPPPGMGEGRGRGRGDKIEADSSMENIFAFIVLNECYFPVYIGSRLCCLVCHV